ncbi:MAG: hypothetical protein [Bacteriophage sp.]|nr:MAG: hypothetical protein [Bacteriophage sp.]
MMKKKFKDALVKKLSGEINHQVACEITEGGVQLFQLISLCDVRTLDDTLMLMGEEDGEFHFHFNNFDQCQIYEDVDSLMNYEMSNSCVTIRFIF